MIRLLVIDDQPRFKTDMEEALRRNGVEANIDFRCPSRRDADFSSELPSGEDFDSYDLVLLDLEFTIYSEQPPPPRSPLDPSTSDYYGGYKILPYIRREAPWLPVVGVSRLFTQPQSVAATAIAGSLGFDALLPKKALVDRQVFNLESWQQLVRCAQASRTVAVVGEEPRIMLLDEPDAAEARARVDAGASLIAALEAKARGWPLLLKRMFHFAESLKLLPLKAGFSGASVYRVVTTFPRTRFGGGGTSEWLLKLSRSPRKLSQEASRHLLFTREASLFARAMPLLWPGIVTTEQTAGLAYQFAAGARTTADVFDEAGGNDTLFARIGRLLADFYRQRGPQQLVSSSAFSNYFNLPRLQAAATAIANGHLQSTIDEIASGDLPGAVGPELPSVRSGLLHGDLHLGNIMLGEERDILIDLARLGIGPIAVDIAKLLSDVILRSRTSLVSSLPGCTRGVDISVYSAVLGPAWTVFDLSESDRALVSLLVPLYLLTSLDYSDVPAPTKAHVTSLLAAWGR